MESLVSIIIPFYNEEHYLKRAIDSAINQTYTNTEIILVNDGSVDNSLIIANSYKHAKISCITTANLGLGNARNIGIEKATGEFITFLDSDDALEKHAVTNLLSNIKLHKSDIAIARFTLYDKELKAFSTTGWLDTNINPINGLLAVEKMYSPAIASTVWAKLYKTSLVKKMLFPTGVWFEDRPFLMEYFLQSNLVSFTTESLLQIYAREGSITRRTISNKRIIDLYNIYKIEMEIAQKYNTKKHIFQTLVHHHLDAILDTFFLLVIDKRKVSNFKELKTTYLKYISSFQKNYKLYGVNIELKKKVLLFLLKTPQIFSWDIVSLILCSLLKKRYQGIKILKES